jgi:hypothetical protein
VVSSSSVREPSSATTKVWTSLISVDGCAVSIVSAPDAGDPNTDDPKQASEAASSTRCLTPDDLELMKGGSACSFNGLSYLTRYLPVSPTAGDPGDGYADVDVSKDRVEGYAVQETLRAP